MEKDKKALLFNGFGLLASLFIILSGPLIAGAMITILVQVFGALLIVWALFTKKFNNVSQSHSLPPGYFFVEKGPYEILRHPIYAGYLLIMVSFVESEFTFLRLMALIIVVIVLLLKIIREEYTMTEKVTEYKAYKAKTKALIPYLL